MGTIIHHSIIVTGYAGGEGAPIHEARLAAIDAGCNVTEVAEHVINGYGTFLVVPDGSKEGWGESDEGDKDRTTFIEWLRERHGCEWVEVSSGEQTPTHKICRSRES